MLDMAHMDLGPLSAASTDTNDSSLHKAGLSPAAAADIHTTTTSSSHHGIFRSDSANATPLAAAAAAPNGSLYGAPLSGRRIGEHEAAAEEDDDGEGTQHTQASSKSYSNALDRVAQTGNRSTHLQHISSGGADGAALQGRFRKTLALRRSDSGLVVGSYVLEPMDSSSSAAAKSSWMQAAMQSAGGGANSRAARSVHGGAAFFREAASKADSSTHVVKASACTSRTVHGGTAHAAAGGGGNQHGSIFYQGQC